MSESVNILIAADNKASAVLQRVGNDVDGLSRRVKDNGRSLKAGSELAGIFARSFGGGQFGALAGEVGQLTEKVSAFSEVSKGGTAGALAFKVALAGAVAVTAFKVGETIGSWWFETKRWREEMQAAATEAERLERIRMDRQQKGFGQTREELSLIYGSGERTTATNAEADRLAKEAEGMSARIQMAREEVARRKATEAWYPMEGNWTEERKIAEQQLQQLLNQRDALSAESQALRDMVSARAQHIEQLKAENAARAKSDSFIQGLRDEIEMLKATSEEQRKIVAGRNAVDGQRGVAEQLLKERDALLEKKKAEKEAADAAAKAAEDRQREAERIQQLEERELSRLEAKRIELEQGKEAARSFLLQQEGLSKASADNIARREAELNRRPIDNSPQEALQGRLLTRGIANTPLDKIAASVEKQVGKLEQLNANLGGKLDKLYEEQKSKSVVLKTVNVP